MNGRREPRRGGALLAVMWLSVVMTAIAFTLARGVRGEFDRAATNLDSLRAYYLAQGAIESVIRRIVAPPRSDESGDEGFEIGQRFARVRFPSGSVVVEIVGESGKLNVNQASREALARLFAASGMNGERALTTAAALVDYRERRRSGAVAFGLSRDEISTRFLDDDSSFSRVAASIQELEELLAVPGITPEWLFGSYREDSGGRLVRSSGLLDSLTTRGSGAAVDVNYASAELLLAAGLAPAQVEAIAALRRGRKLRREDVGDLESLDGPIRLGAGTGGSIAYTLRAEAELDNGRARRTVAAVIERANIGGPDPIRVARWYDGVL